MLFPYKYISHSMEKMQGYIDYIFFELWCKAPSREYDESLFDDNIELKEVIADFYYSETKGGKFFTSKLLEIYELFRDLPDIKIKRLKNWYQANNDIEGLCSAAAEIEPVRYAELNEFHDALADKLADFFKRLFDQDMLGLASVTGRIGTIDDHYKSFMTANLTGKCPFCGLHDVKGIHHSKREAYDHYLLKSIYPFISINFRNLAPMCHECNSSYKLSKDPLHDNANKRRKAFYSYSSHQPAVTIGVIINNPDIDALKPDDIELTIDCYGYGQEVTIWMELFGIDERYKAKCISESDGKNWIRQIFDAENYNISAIDYLIMKKKQAGRDPFSDANFLRKPFLEACEKMGVFNDV